jgi:large subunit ribosomal protein L35
MPKMKTHSGAKKRFKVTATGKVRGRHAFTSHILEKKSSKRKRTHAQPAVISGHDVPRIKRMLNVPSASRTSPGRPDAASGSQDRAPGGGS